MSLSKIHLPPKSTGNTQEAVAPIRPDMTEKLFTGTLSKNETKRNSNCTKLGRIPKFQSDLFQLTFRNDYDCFLTSSPIKLSLNIFYSRIYK